MKSKRTMYLDEMYEAIIWVTWRPDETIVHKPTSVYSCNSIVSVNKRYKKSIQVLCVSVRTPIRINLTIWNVRSHAPLP